MRRTRDLADQVVVVTGAVRGIAGRAPRVYGQRWLPPVQLARGIIPPIVARLAARAVPEIESRWLAAGSDTPASRRRRCGRREGAGPSRAS
ncbi:MAG TPA: hypothetical protein VGR98_01510 [Streptosporangiaceae bacterium]|nr:hypothetical protein [Streptosporangiaceae bacterium]